MVAREIQQRVHSKRLCMKESDKVMIGEFWILSISSNEDTTNYKTVGKMYIPAGTK